MSEENRGREGGSLGQRNVQLSRESESRQELPTRRERQREREEKQKIEWQKIYGLIIVEPVQLE